MSVRPPEAAACWSRLTSRKCWVSGASGRWVPYVDRQLTPLVNLGGRLGRLADHESLDLHRVLGQLDERDLEVQPAHHPHEHVVEQPTDIRYGDPSLMFGMAVQPDVQRPEAVQHVCARVIGGEIGIR